MNYQKVILVGNVTKDAKRQTSKKGDIHFTTFSLAVSNGKDSTTYFPVVAFGKLGEVIAKYFNPAGAGTWYAIEYDPKDRILFGYVSIFGDWNDEWGYFSLDELQNYRGRFGLGIERDLSFEEQRASQIINKITERG